MIIAAYPCTGKSTLSARRWERCIDLETSNFDKHNPYWAEYYADVAEDLFHQGGACSQRHVFVSTHPDVIDALKDNENFVLVFPALTLKDVMVKRAEIRYNEIKNRYEAYKFGYEAVKENDGNGQLVIPGLEHLGNIDALQITEEKVHKLAVAVGKDERALARIRDHYEEDINALMQYNCNKFIFSDQYFYLEKLFGNN